MNRQIILNFRWRGVHQNTERHSHWYLGGTRTHHLSPWRTTNNRAIWCSFKRLIDTKPYVLFIELMVILIAKVVPCEVPPYQMHRPVKCAPYEDPDIVDCRSLGTVDSECETQTANRFPYYYVRIVNPLETQSVPRCKHFSSRL